MIDEPTRRKTDGWFGWLTRLWDWFDDRDIDKHVMAWATFYITIRIVSWAAEFIDDHPDKPGLEVAAIVTAVMLPWTPVQAKVIQWYFDSRTTS